MWEFLAALGNIMSVSVGAVGLAITFMAVGDWAIGRICRYWKRYSVFIQYLIDYRDYQEWRKKKK